MPEDKIIKSGQITFPRVLILLVAGTTIFFIVYQGGVFLTVGYWLITLALCALLLLVAIDYGVRMDSTELQPQAATGSILRESTPVPAARQATATAETRPRRRTARPAKRRR